MNQITAIGIDLGKSVFYVHAVDRRGKVVERKRLTRTGLRRYMLRVPPCLVGMEACGGSQHWARWLSQNGHEAKLMPAQYVKAYVKTNKNDWRDAEAICESVQRPTMRFVPVKTVEQQELQMLHRIRSRVVGDRTALVNQIRGFLLEYGIAVGQGIKVLRRRLPEVLEDGEAELTWRGRELLARLYQELCELDERVWDLTKEIEAICQERDDCRRLDEMVGVGPLTATALVAAAGDARVFGSARQFAAWLGLVPRQHTTGGRPRLLGISKRGDKYLRTLLIHCARAALRGTNTRDERLRRWALEVEKRRGKNVAIVALANKLARIAWVVLARGERYTPKSV
jgi:transposase